MFRENVSYPHDLLPLQLYSVLILCIDAHVRVNLNVSTLRHKHLTCKDFIYSLEQVVFSMQPVSQLLGIASDDAPCQVLRLVQIKEIMHGRSLC